MDQKRLAEVCRCQKHLKLSTRNLSWLPGIILAILPKCPLCMFSYSSALTMCTGSKVYLLDSDQGNPIFLSLAVLLFLSLLINWRGRRTLVAIVIALIGWLMMGSYVYFQIPVLIFYFGSVLILLACFTNANLVFFLRKISHYRIRNGLYRVFGADEHLLQS